MIERVEASQFTERRRKEQTVKIAIENTALPAIDFTCGTCQIGPSYHFHSSAKYTDSESGLLYYGYRYYQANLGMWLNRDPLYSGGDYESIEALNLYSIVNNAPVTYVDVDGQGPYPPAKITDLPILPISGPGANLFTGGPPDGADPATCKCKVKKDSFKIEPDPGWQDAGNVRRKRVKFTYEVEDGNDPKDCELVQWVNGSIKDTKNNKFKKGIKFYEYSGLEATTENGWMVDSRFIDPRYLANVGSDKQTAGTKFTTWDNPSIPKTYKHTTLDWHFKMCIYDKAIVPKQVTLYQKNAHPIGSIPGKAIICLEWKAKIVIDESGKITSEE